MTFGDDLCGLLGLAQGTHVSETQHVPTLCNMFYGLSYLFVYTNLVRGRLVGDTESPLLRAIPVYGNYGDATHEFRHIHYTEAASFNSDVVEVNIRTGVPPGTIRVWDGILLWQAICSHRPGG